MITRNTDVHVGTDFTTSEIENSEVFRQGIVAGAIGAATVALWFFAIDVIAGRPLYTPTVLGTALFHHGAGLDSPQSIQPAFETVVVFTWVHFLIFAVIGGAVSYLVSVAEKRPRLGFGIVLLFVLFEYGFLAVNMIFAQDVLQALSWPGVLAGNVLAAVTMGIYLWRKHPNLRILP